MRSIHARDCQVDIINDSRARSFTSSCQRRKSIEGKSISLGLFESQELIGVIQFCSPQTHSMQKEYTRELASIYFVQDVVVTGGVDKLLTYYLSIKSPSDVFIYQDVNLELNTIYEKCGFTLVNQSGKYVYEWINPDLTFYTYKITSPHSDKYYLGVRHIKKKNASMNDCLKDNYWGSGTSPHFARWSKKYIDSLAKEILQTFSKKSKAYGAEANLIGSLYKNDPNCLNSTVGGLHGGIGLESNLISIKDCPTHGAVKHIGNKCYSCTNKNSTKMGVCFKHGQGLFHGASCYKCQAEKMVSVQKCPIHGKSKFSGGNCVRCRAQRIITTMVCSIHGSTKHRAGVCSQCTALRGVWQKECPIHGFTYHQGDVCNKCHAKSNLSHQDCYIHGRTSFIGNKCRKCISKDSVTVQTCLIHGKTKFLGDRCCTCQFRKMANIQTCPLHGETKFRKNSCEKCIAQRQKKPGVCSIHGKETFYKNTCPKCKAIQMKHSRLHKEVHDNTCFLCCNLIASVS
jgi:hypothetical protein